MTTKLCENKSDCVYIEICKPKKLDIDIIYDWLMENSNKCSINLRYIDIDKNNIDIQYVYYKEIDHKCSFFFTFDDCNIYIYVNYEIFKKRNYMGSHITINNITIGEGLNKYSGLSLHSTIYNATNTQYTFYKLDNDYNLICIDENGIIQYNNPINFLNNLWNRIRCELQTIENQQQIQKSKTWANKLFKSCTPSKTGGLNHFIKDVKKLSNNKCKILFKHLQKNYDVKHMQIIDLKLKSRLLIGY
jgi:hypothetical protein